MTSQKLIELCQHVGQVVPFWTQGPGGNISMKIQEETGLFLYIKASGFRLDQITANSGLAKVELDNLLKQLKNINPGDDAEQTYAQLLKDSAIKAEGLGRPSMETGFHAMLPQKYVMHFHSIAALLAEFEYQKNPNSFSDYLNQFFDKSWSMLPPLRPGLLLSLEVAKHPESNVFFLGNHGIILQSEEIETLHRWREFETKFLSDYDYISPQKAEASNKPTPFRFYWPDTAVFLPRIQAILEKVDAGQTEPFFRLKPNALDVDLDACEIWDATEILYHLCPEMTELPDEIVSTVANLPTEKFRQHLGTVSEAKA